MELEQLVKFEENRHLQLTVHS